MTTCYPYQCYNYPITCTKWSPIVMNPLYTVPVPIIVNPPALSHPICRYMPPVVPLISPMVSTSASPISSYQESISELEYSIDSFYDEPVKDTNVENPMEYYLSLPKDLFPSARDINIDPNNLIDEFCKLSDVERHVAWILDLEFGIPKSPITRPIPCYNVKYNSIQCKNTPEAIHPGFESCSRDFKRALLFYYDCVVSAWYRSYMYLYCDKSVENFQSWLMIPMMDLGMCWS